MLIRQLVAGMLAAASLVIPAHSYAQSERGSITGVVTDSTKAALPGVTVKVVGTRPSRISNIQLATSISPTASS